MRALGALLVQDGALVLTPGVSVTLRAELEAAHVALTLTLGDARVDVRFDSPLDAAALRAREASS